MICLNVSSIEVTNTSVTNKNDADSTTKVDKSQSVLFGSVGAALTVGTIAVVGIVFVVVVAVKWRKKNKNGIPTGILSTINMTRVTKE